MWEDACTSPVSDGEGPLKAHSFGRHAAEKPLPPHELRAWGDELLPLERAAAEGAGFHMERVSMAYAINPAR